MESGETFDLLMDRKAEGVIEIIEEHHTMVCETKGEIASTTFYYGDHLSHTDTEAPWSLGGHSKDGFHDVPYLVVPGEKEITVVGSNESGDDCFRQVIPLSFTELKDFDDHSRLLQSCPAPPCCGSTCCCGMLK